MSKLRFNWRNDTLPFLRLLGGNDYANFTFQTFDDSKEKRPHLARIFHGTIHDHKVELMRLNDLGAGIFVTVNETDLNGRTKSNIERVRALFVDSDTGPLPELAVPPSIKVTSKRGEHAYWLLSTDLPLEMFSLVQKELIKKLNTDKSIHDLPRVMRLPGFWHMKDPQDPFLVQMQPSSGESYQYDNLASGFEFNSDSEPEENEVKFGNSKFDFGKFTEWAKTLPAEESDSNKFGGRNNTVIRLVREGLGQGFSITQLEPLVSGYCTRSGLPVEEAQEILIRQALAHNSKPFQPFQDPDQSSKPADLAESFLSYTGYRTEKGLGLRWYRDEFFKWNGKHYESVGVRDLRADVVSWLQSLPEVRKHAGSRYANEIIVNLEAITKVEPSKVMPCWLDGEKGDTSDLIIFNNGILEVSHLIRGSKGGLREHSPNLFIQSCLPFDYQADADCPIWTQFLETVHPKVTTRDLLQEWFGYNLCHDVTQEKFAIFFGEGANGKSVCCVVLRELLGEKNVSAVGLEAFNPTRTFPLAATLGKLANIVEEIGEIDQTAEGLLKNYVSGGQMTIERKHKDAFQVIPSARLTLATNVLPRFVDRTDALWRRLLLIRFEFQILNEEKQNKNLKNPTWWRSSGEMSGILNWAIAGLIRLRSRGSFLESSEAKDAKSEYKREANPAKAFLLDFCVFKPGVEVGSFQLYQAYREYQEGMGQRSLAETQFAKEVRRVFPSVELSKNPMRVNKRRTRVWYGLQLHELILSDY
jgi:putative DNA primase/helicase